MFLELEAAPSLFDTPQQDQHAAELLPAAIVLWSPYFSNTLNTAGVTWGYGNGLWTHDLLGSRSQIHTVGGYGSHVLIRWCVSGWEISRSGGPSPCFPLSALPCSTSEHDCGVSVSPRRDIKMCSECLGKLVTLFSEQKKPLSHIAKQVPSFPWYLGQLIQ